MLKDGVAVAKYEMQEYWLDIRPVQDFDKAQDIYSSTFKDCSSK